MQIKGKIETISSKGDGVKVNNAWYDLPPNLQKLKLEKDMDVTLSLMDDNKTVKFINFGDGPTKYQPKSQTTLKPKEEFVFDNEAVLTDIGRHFASIWKLLQKS